MRLFLTRMLPLEALECQREVAYVAIQKMLEQALVPLVENLNLTVVQSCQRPAGVFFGLGLRSNHCTCNDCRIGTQVGFLKPPFGKGWSSWQFCHSTLKVGFFIAELSRVGLWPLYEKIRTCSLNDLRTKIEDLKDFEPGGPFIRKTCTCQLCSQSTVASLRQGLEEALRPIVGLCLGCEKIGIHATYPKCGNRATEACRNAMAWFALPENQQSSTARAEVQSNHSISVRDSDSDDNRSLWSG